MKLWLAKKTEVPMREQLVTQITLGIASGDLQVGEKLPSRQEISRRFKIHANTVSNAYQELSDRNLVEFRQGSGFYVNEFDAGNLEEKIDIDTLVARFFETAKSLGFSGGQINESLQKRLDSKQPKSFLVVESDKPLREILVEEIGHATRAKVYGISFEDFENEHKELDTNFVALFDEKRKIDPILSSDETCFYLKSGSVPEAMKGENRPTEDSLIAVVSNWKSFLLIAKTILVAAKVDGDSIVTRSTEEENWKRGLDSSSLIICDFLTAKHFPKNKKLRIFRVVSDDSMSELRQIVETRPK